MNQVDMGSVIKDAAATLTDLFARNMQASVDLFQSLSNTSNSMLTQMTGAKSVSDMTRSMTDMLKGLGKPSCGCEIPTPCWMPKPLGEVTTFVCAGATATVRMRVTNRSNQRREIAVDTQQSGIQLTVNPPSLALGPMERGTITISGQVPANTNNGQEFESLVWVRGCNEYYLRWLIKTASRGTDCCHELDVNDCPDYIHHWYDHFYCPRPCSHQSRKG